MFIREITAIYKMTLNSKSLNVSIEGTPWESELKASLHADCEDGKSWMKMSRMQLYKMQHGEKIPQSTVHTGIEGSW